MLPTFKEARVAYQFKEYEKIKDKKLREIIKELYNVGELTNPIIEQLTYRIIAIEKEVKK